MTDPYTPATTIADVKPAFKSKTNITAALLALFGMLVALGVLPASLATPEAVGSIIAGGSALIAVFRTISNAVIK